MCRWRECTQFEFIVLNVVSNYFVFVEKDEEREQEVEEREGAQQPELAANGCVVLRCGCVLRRLVARAAHQSPEVETRHAHQRTQRDEHNNAAPVRERETVCCTHTRVISDNYVVIITI